MINQNKLEFFLTINNELGCYRVVFDYSIQNKILMIVAQLPSLEEIYDYSSQDLKKIVQQLTHKINNTNNDPQQRESLQTYIENINIELEERKTLQFFQQLCAVDNPYLKKVTDFNNEFLKLAEQAIAQQQGKQCINRNQSAFDQSKTKIKSHEDNNDSLSVASHQPPFSEMGTEDKFHKNEKISTTTQQRKSGKEDTIKRGIGSQQNKMKNSMKDFILSTLTKNKVEGCYVIKKGGPPKPQPSYTVNQRGHLVSSNTLQPISTKNIKNHSTQKVPPLPQTSTKQMIQPANERNEKELQKKRQEAIQKVKGNKAQKKKEKVLNNKDLVQLIREQEKTKMQKAKKKQLQKVNGYESIKKIQKQNVINPIISQNIQTIVQQKQPTMQRTVSTDTNQNYEIQEQIQIEAHNLIVDDQKKQQIKSPQVIDEVIVVQEPEKKEQRTQIKVELKREKIDRQLKQETIIQTKKVQIKTDKQNKEIQQSQNTNGDIKIQNIQTKTQKEQNNSYKSQIDQLQKMRQEFEEQLQRNKQRQKIKDAEETLQQKTQNDIKPQQETAYSKEKENKAKQQTVVKKCYNEQYWIHIRQEAEYKIKRFKEEKQISEVHKKSIKSDIQKSISDRNSNQEIQAQQRQDQQSNLSGRKQTNIEQQVTKIREDELPEDEFIQMRKKQLKKMINDHNKRKMPKRASAIVVAPPKHLYALPTFNYLEIYPTFNHIFSVMYTKAEHQALMDIPAIMKDLTAMFSTHLSHFKDKNSYFQPAIFLPFDSSNNAHLADPRQLLLHAQNTYVNLKKMVERLQAFNGNLHGQFNQIDQRYYRVVKTKQQVYDIISTGFLRRKGWKELPHGCSLRSTWNLFWSWSKPDIDISKLLVWQRINHYPFNKNLSRKDLLYKNLDSFRKMLKIPFNFLPLTFNLPKEYTQFSMKFHEQQIVNKDRNYWIMKPIGKSRGRGIKVVSNLAQLNYTDNIVVQKYINNPLLLDGYKFDMRIYVLVTNFHPLEAFVYKQGFARLSTQKFSLDPMSMKNAFVHLTNFAVNKNNEDAKHSSNFSGGSKISLKILKDKLARMNYSFNNIWTQVHQIIIKSLLGCSISVPPFPTAFELFGYDIMIDTDSNCHLIEINASPSLQRAYMIDQVIKQSLIDDILDIVDPPDFDKEQLLDVMSERMSGKKKITPDEDLIAIARILKYKKLRKFGEIPESIGLFEMIAPSKLSTDLQKLIKGRSGANNPKNID